MTILTRAEAKAISQSGLPDLARRIKESASLGAVTLRTRMHAQDAESLRELGYSLKDFSPAGPGDLRGDTWTIYWG